MTEIRASNIPRHTYALIVEIYIYVCNNNDSSSIVHNIKVDVRWGECECLGILFPKSRVLLASLRMSSTPGGSTLLLFGTILEPC